VETDDCQIVAFRGDVLKAVVKIERVLLGSIEYRKETRRCQVQRVHAKSHEIVEELTKSGWVVAIEVRPME
jgi:mannose/fructose/N-acetylgalactosamine-specific phosphotransferase system component IIB